MDVKSILESGGYVHENPEYNPKTKKGQYQPKYIVNADPNGALNQGSALADVLGQPNRQMYNLNYLGDPEKYGRYGININPISKDLDEELADAQSVLNKARNSLIQTVSEGTLGTVKAFADLFDLVTLSQLRQDSDYQNAISTEIEKWQKSIRESMPIYTHKDVNILNGGLLDSGFIFSGLPSIISSLTLLIPSKAVTFGLTKGIGWATRNGIKFTRSVERANKAAQLGDTAKGASNVARINAYINGPAGKTAKNIIDYGIGGLTSRLLENYQESRQTYDESRPVYTRLLKEMSPAEKTNVIEDLKNTYGDNAADWSDDNSIATLVARKSADETFKDDMANIFFDIYQMYAIGKATRIINGPSRSALNRLNKFNIKTAGMSDEAVAKLLASRTRWDKARDWVTDRLIGGRSAVLSELTEGIEEAVNYIAQEEGFHYGKVLLNQEKDTPFWSTRLTEYVKNPTLWDSAWWGLVGGVVFNKGGEYANRTVQAIDTIKKAKEKAKNQVTSAAQPVKIPTFREAFRDTELGVRKLNLENSARDFNDTRKKLERIQAGEDLYGITSTGKLELQEEIDAAKEMAIREFRDKLLLNAMDVGNYDLVKTYLSSDELKQAFVSDGTLTQDQADRIQSETLSRGDELLRDYNKHLRRIYNAVADWGDNNDADLTQMPAEIFNLIARQNMSHELSAKYYAGRIARLEEANAILESDSREEIDKALRESGVASFKDAIRAIYKIQTLGTIEAEINDIIDKKQHTTAAGQAVLKTFRAQKAALEESLKQDLSIKLDGTNDIDDLANILLSSQTIAAIEPLPEMKNKQRFYTVNTNNARFNRLLQAINTSDRKILSELSDDVKAILERNPVSEEGDTFLKKVRDRANVIDNIRKTTFDDKGNLKILKDINAQLESNYKQIAALEVNRLFEESNVYKTRTEIQRRASTILDELTRGGRAESIETATLLYQQLAKKYGKENIKEELRNYILTGRHTDTFNNFNSDEQSAYETLTTIIKLNRPEQDIVLEDIYDALNLNDIYEYTKDKDVVELLKEAKQKREDAAAQNSSTSQNANSDTTDQQSNNQSGTNKTQSSEQGNGQIDERLRTEEPAPVPLNDNDVNEGRVDIDENNRTLTDEELHNLNDAELASAISNLENIINSSETTEEDRNSATENYNLLKSEQERRASNSSTGEVTQPIDQSDIVNAIENAVNQLRENNPGNIDSDKLRSLVSDMTRQLIPGIDDATLNDLVDSSFAIVEGDLQDRGESIESVLTGNMIKLSRIASNSKSQAAVNEARAMMDRTFSNLLDIFNRYLSNGVVDGKYLIPLESLIRYARAITNNEFEAQELYNSFINTINNNSDKYRIINGRNIERTKIVANASLKVAERRAYLDSNIGGRTLNLDAALSGISDKEERDKKRKEIVEVVKALKPGDKLYVRANYDNEKIGDITGELFIGGIDFVVIKSDGTEVLVSKVPTPSFDSADRRYWTQRNDGWYYRFPRGNEMGKVEYSIQTFFKELFTSDDENAVELRRLLAQYESLNGKEIYEDVGEKIIKDAHAALERFAKVFEKNNPRLPYNSLSDFIFRGTYNERGNRSRIAHLASLDIYTKNNWIFDLEENNYQTNDIKQERNDSYKESINKWFNKMIESSEARYDLTSRLKLLGDGLFDLNVEVEEVGEPVLVQTKEENKLPFSKAIAEQHKDSAKLGAGSIDNNATVTISNGQPIELQGNTMGRSVVVITDNSGKIHPVNAYPVQANNSVFNSNVKLKAFKEALSIKLDELMDEWFNTTDSTNLQAFLYSLGHQSIDERKNKFRGHLFAGFLRTILPKGNGFSIAYKRVNGKVVSPTSSEDGEVHMLTFYDSVPTRTRGIKARAAVQDYVRGRASNPTVVWNTNPTDTSTLRELNVMKAIVKEVIIDSLAIRIDPLNINADNDSNISYGDLMGRDKDGKFVLKVTGIKNPSESLKEYVQPNGDIVIGNIGRNGNSGNFSDFIIGNDLVDLTTKPVDGSNFTIFNHSDGAFGIKYKINSGISSPVEKVTVVPQAESLSKLVKDALASKRAATTNNTRTIIKLILDRIGNANPNLNNLLKRNTLLNMFLHKSVVYVEGFNGAAITYPNNKTDIVPDDAYAAYIPENVTLRINGKETKISKGQIVVGDKFMQLLDGNAGAIADALHHLLHENVHAFIADNDEANNTINKKYKKELEDIWDEFTKKNPTSTHAKTKDYKDIEEFIVESLTDTELMRELNNTLADNPLSAKGRPKSLLGKLLDSLINWLSDLLGKDFKLNKDSLLSKEYALFEEAIINNSNTSSRTSTSRKVIKKASNTSYTEGALQFEDTENSSDEVTEGTTKDVADFKIEITAQQSSNINIDDDDDIPISRPRGNRYSTIGNNSFSSIQGALNKLDGEEYIDIKEKINNGVLSIKCK